MRSIPKLLFLLCCLLPAMALSAASLSWTDVPKEVRPGKSVRLIAACTGTADVTLMEKDGSVLATLARSEEAQDGEVRLYWDGYDDSGEAIPPGKYTLRIRQGDAVADAALSVGEEAPMILNLVADDFCDGDWHATVETSIPGTLTLTLATPDGDVELLATDCYAGETELQWDGMIDYKIVANGDWEMTLRLIDRTGDSSNPETFTVTMDWPSLATDIEYHTPAEDSPIPCDHEPCYWNLNMGEMDEVAIWEILTQPVTVVKGKQRERVKLRAEPSDKCTDYVGEVTCTSQAVHLLDEQGDWTLVEVYSSSAEGSKVKVWALKVQGWIKTSLLQEKDVDQEYGLVVDKLQQRMYLFKDGHLYSTLLVSTGFPKASAPFNETPAGEFLIVSWTGGFYSEELYCDYALRINSGILIHEVPCYPIYASGSTTEIADKDFANFENYLGEKASHGCIRTQRRKTPEGVNMKWLWDNLNRKQPTKVIIWDELGRTLGYPDNDVKLYYNPDGGKSYHSSPVCAEVNQKYWPLTAFTYGELEDDQFASLRRCKACAPQLRMREIDELNEDNHR